MFFEGENNLSGYQNKVDEFEKMIKEEEKYLKSLYYKHKCIKTNQEIYLWLYSSELHLFRKYVTKDRNINLGLRDLYRKIGRNKNFNKDEDEDDEYGNGKITKKGYLKGKKLWGKVQFVTSYPDFTVQVVENFPDLRVEKVERFPDSKGRWEFVNKFPDFTIQYVDSRPDFTIQFVENFPGLP